MLYCSRATPRYRATCRRATTSSTPPPTARRRPPQLVTLALSPRPFTPHFEIKLFCFNPLYGQALSALLEWESTKAKLPSEQCNTLHHT